MDYSCREIVQKIDDHLIAHPKTTLKIAAERLGIPGATIEKALREQEGMSFQEFLANKRLREAFAQLSEYSSAVDGQYSVKRARRRVFFPKTTVKYQVHTLWIRKSKYSDPHPLVDLSSEGLAFLSDEAPKPQKRVSMILKFPGEESEFRLRGHIAYTLATGIAGYRYRVGVQFLPFADRRGCNDLKTLDFLLQIEKTYES